MVWAASHLTHSEACGSLHAMAPSCVPWLALGPLLGMSSSFVCPDRPTTLTFPRLAVDLPSCVLLPRACQWSEHLVSVYTSFPGLTVTS